MDKWVSWLELLNKSKKQTLGELKEFLISKGLSDGGKASAKARRLNFARVVDSKERWNLKQYIFMMQADAKLRKLEAQNKPIHPALRRRANP